MVSITLTIPTIYKLFNHTLISKALRPLILPKVPLNPNRPTN